MFESSSFLALLAMGLLSSAHCLGMCGGIAASLGFAVQEKNPSKKILIVLAYNAGRILSYVFIGALVGGVLGSLNLFLQTKLGANDFSLFFRGLAGVLLIATGFYISQWWMGLIFLEKVGHKLWIYIQPFSQALMPVKKIHQGFLLGCVWGWLPCGLVYSALAIAIVQANALSSGLGMLAFGLGTLPSVLSAGIVSQFSFVGLTKFFQQKYLRVIFSLCFILAGVWTIYSAAQHSAHHSEIDHSTMNHEHMHH